MSKMIVRRKPLSDYDKNDFQKVSVNINKSQMERRSILGNAIYYVQYNRNHIDFNKLDSNALNSKDNKRIYKRLEEDDRQVIGLDFGDTSEKLSG